LQGAGVDVAESAEMQLLGPAGLRVEMAEIEHQVRGKFGVLFMRCGLPGARLLENGARARFAAEICVTMGQAVVGKTAASLMEEIVAFAQGVQEAREGTDMDVGGGSETLDPEIEDGGEVNVQGAIGAKGRVDARGQLGRGDLGVGLQIVGGVVGGTEGAAHRISPEFLARLVLEFPEACWRAAKFSGADSSSSNSSTSK